MSAAQWAETRLGHAFRDAALLEAALTHRSAGKRNYERLEFLGDAVLNFTVTVIFRFKQLAGCPRPVEYSAQIQPLTAQINRRGHAEGKCDRHQPIVAAADDDDFVIGSVLAANSGVCHDVSPE